MGKLHDPISTSAKSLLDAVLDFGSLDHFCEWWADNPERGAKFLAVECVSSYIYERNQLVKESLTTELVKNPYNITDKMMDAAWAAEAEYEKMILRKVFPRPQRPAFVYAAMRKAEKP